MTTCGSFVLDGSEMKDLRLRLGMSQQELADALGQHRLTIVQYERGFRHKDKKAIAISKVVEMACLALWGGLSSYEEVFGGEVSEQQQVLPEHAVPESMRARALRVLERRGVRVGLVRYFFPWARFRPLWPEIDTWCQEHSPGHKLHTVLNIDQFGGGIAVLELPESPANVHFKLRWISGREGDTDIPRREP